MRRVVLLVASPRITSTSVLLFASLRWPRQQTALSHGISQSGQWLLRCLESAQTTSVVKKDLLDFYFTADRTGKELKVFPWWEAEWNRPLGPVNGLLFLSLDYGQNIASNAAPADRTSSLPYTRFFLVFPIPSAS